VAAFQPKDMKVGLGRGMVEKVEPNKFSTAAALQF
jgi:hypothetical protein